MGKNQKISGVWHIQILPFQEKFDELWTKPPEISSNSDNLYNCETINFESINYNCILFLNLQILIYVVAFFIDNLAYNITGGRRVCF